LTLQKGENGLLDLVREYNKIEDEVDVPIDVIHQATGIQDLKAI